MKNALTLIGVKLFEGKVTVPVVPLSSFGNMDSATEISGFTADKTKIYGVFLTVDGDKLYATSMTAFIITAPEIGLIPNSKVLICMNNNNVVAYSADEEEHEVIINEIYEIGEVDNYVTENGFELLYIGEQWTLVKTPDTRYIVPHTVAGVTVDAVYIDCISGEPIFDKAYELSTSDLSYWKPNLVKVTTTDYEFIFSIPNNSRQVTFDLSECGDNVQIPDQFLSGGYSETIIYVSQSVKVNYADYDNVVAK